MRKLLFPHARLLYLASLALGLSVLLATFAWSGDPDALWNIVHQKCVPDQEQHADPAPCIEVNIANGEESGFAVLKDNAPTKPYEYLLIPTRRITGIESLLILASDTPNYFEDAWAARSYVSRLVQVELAPDMIALAVNSARDRTQNQLHIHVDCVRPDMRSLLKEKEETLTDRWSKIEAAGYDYMALKLSAEAWARSNPFRLLADGIEGAGEHMDLETLVAVGAVFQDGSTGFYLLSRRGGLLSSAHGEDLIDPTCRLKGREDRLR